VLRHRKKLSGPVLDRIDIEAYVPRIPYAELMNESRAEHSSVIRDRVIAVRDIQKKRFVESGIYNALMTSRDVRTHCALDVETSSFVEQASLKLGLSARSIFRILKVARTIADMEASETVQLHHVAEAVSYKSIDSQYRKRTG
jgi:magnesium chelatase family protein